MEVFIGFFIGFMVCYAIFGTRSVEVNVYLGDGRAPSGGEDMPGRAFGDRSLLVKDASPEKSRFPSPDDDGPAVCSDCKERCSSECRCWCHGRAEHGDDSCV